MEEQKMKLSKWSRLKCYSFPPLLFLLFCYRHVFLCPVAKKIKSFHGIWSCKWRKS
jgi:hypothetical protein